MHSRRLLLPTDQVSLSTCRWWSPSKSGGSISSSRRSNSRRIANKLDENCGLRISAVYKAFQSTAGAAECGGGLRARVTKRSEFRFMMVITLARRRFSDAIMRWINNRAFRSVTGIKRVGSAAGGRAVRGGRVGRGGMVASTLQLLLDPRSLPYTGMMLIPSLNAVPQTGHAWADRHKHGQQNKWPQVVATGLVGAWSQMRHAATASVPAIPWIWSWMLYPTSSLCRMQRICKANFRKCAI